MPKLSLKQFIAMVALIAVAIGASLMWLRSPYEVRYEFSDGLVAKKELWRYDISIKPFGFTTVPIEVEELYRNGKIAVQVECRSWTRRCFAPDGKETDYMSMCRHLENDRSGIQRPIQVSFRPKYSVLEQLLVKPRRVTEKDNHLWKTDGAVRMIGSGE